MSNTIETIRNVRRKLPSYRNAVDRLSLERQEGLIGWLFVTPKSLIILSVIGYPILFGIYVSFTDASLTEIPGPFIGLENYVWLLEYDVFWLSIRNVLLIGVVLVPTNIFFSFTTALLIMEKFRGSYFYRTAFLIPVAGPPLIWAIVWRLVLFPTNGGIINSLLLSAGLRDAPVKFLSADALAMPSVILSLIWGFGISMLIYMAALSGLPSSLMDAAKMDGADRFSRIRYIIWPLMKPTTFFLVVIHVILVYQFGFAAVFILTQGGPGNATMVPSYFIYTLAFSFHDFGRSAAAAIIIFVLTTVTTLLVWKPLQNQAEYYQ